jgi:hypothetical protein
MNRQSTNRSIGLAPGDYSSEKRAIIVYSGGSLAATLMRLSLMLFAGSLRDFPQPLMKVARILSAQQYVRSSPLVHAFQHLQFLRIA